MVAGTGKMLAAGNSEGLFALEGRIRLHGENLRLNARLIDQRAERWSGQTTTTVSCKFRACFNSKPT